MNDGRLVTAAKLEREHGIPRSTAYRLAKLGTIPSYRVGPKMTGIRFRADEVLATLRRPVKGE